MSEALNKPIMELAQRIYVHVVASENEYGVYEDPGASGDLLYSVASKNSWIHDPASLEDIAGQCIDAALAFQRAWVKRVDSAP